MIRGLLAGRREAAVVAGLVGLFLAFAGWALHDDASVADEHPHILCGFLYWKSGQFSGGLDNPPLGQLLVALPLVLGGHEYEYPSDRGLAWARLPVLLAGIALAILIWRWGRHLGGPATGVAALLALVLEPNLLAHGHLATLDFPLTVLWWTALAALRGVLFPGPDARPRGLRSIWPFAVLFAVAFLTKFSALVLLPATLATVVVMRRDRPTIVWGLAAIVAALAAAFVLAHVAYGFGPTRFGVPQALVEAIGGKLTHRGEVQFAYLAGQRSESGFLLYYIVALALKTPLPLLGLASAGIVVLVRRRQLADLVLLVLPAAFLVAAFTAIRVNIGLRHVLPVMPALCLLAGVGAVALWRARTAGRVAVAVAALVWVAGIARVAPQWIPYFNELAGGPVGGHRYLLDSNLDWGQDDRRQARALAAAERDGRPYMVLPDPLVPRTGRIAVNANALHNLQRRNWLPYAWLRPLPIDGTAGASWRLYDLDPSDYAAHTARAPGDPIAAWAEAEVAFGAGDAVGGSAVFRQALQRIAAPPARAQLALLAARSAARRGDRAAAADWVRLGQAAAPGDADLERTAQELDLEKAATEEPDATRRAHAAAELGLMRAEAGRVEEALPWLRQAAATLTDDLETQRLLAVAEARRGDWDRAVAILERPALLAAYPDEADLCAAMQATERALVSGDPDPDLVLELGRALFEANAYDRAAAAFLRRLATHPGDRLAVAYLGEMQVRSKMRIVDARLTPRRVPGR